jgi:polyhydroxyalkanoate synthesis regulator phasin
MNDILHDIKKLEDIQASVGQFSASTVKSFIQDMINEKQNIILEFESNVPAHIKELNNKIKGDI